MKRITVVLVLLMLLLTTLALAQQEPQKATAQPAGKMGMMHGMMQGKGGQGAMMGLLKLTDEQRSKMQDLRLAHQKEMVPLRADLQKLQANLKLEITAEKFNESKVKSIQGEISKLMSEIGSKTILHQRAVRDILTPEQKKQFDSRVLSGGIMGGVGPMGRDGMMGAGGRMGARGPMGMGRGMRGPGGPATGTAGMCDCKCEKMK